MLAALIATAALLQAAEPQPIDGSAVQALMPAVRFESFSNGLRVAVVEDHALPLVSVQLWYRVGSAYDDIDNPGLCHVTRTIVEHREDAALRLRAAGVRFESKTLRDACYFSSVLPPNFLEYVLDIEAARMTAFEVTPAMVKTGLNAAARDLNILRESDADRAEEYQRPLWRAMFPKHPYQHPPGLVADSLRDLTPADVREFLDRWFVAGNATLLVTGDVSTIKVLEQVRDRFAKLPWKDAPRRTYTESPGAEVIEIEVATRTTPFVRIAFLTPRMGAFENAAIEVLLHSLLNGIDGPLHAELVKEGYPWPVGWTSEKWQDAGLVTLWLHGVPQRDGAPAWRDDPKENRKIIRKWLALIDRYLAKARTHSSDPVRHNRARALAAADRWSARLDFGDRAVERARNEVVAGDLLLMDFGVAQIERVSVADVQRAARLLSESRRVIAYYRPDAAGTVPLAPRPIRALRKVIGAGQVLERLAAHASNLPPVIAPRIHPRVESRTAGDIPVTVCTLPGSNWAGVALLEWWPGEDDRHVWVLPAPRPVETDIRGLRGKAIDYATYHGAVRQHVLPHLYGHGGPNGEFVTVETDKALAMLEWLVQVMSDERSGAAPRPTASWPVEVFAIGELTSQAVVDSLKSTLGQLAGPLTAPRQDDSNHHSRPHKLDAGRTNRRPRIEMKAHTDEAPLGFFSALLVWDSVPDRQKLSPTQVRTLAILLGRTPHDSPWIGVDADSAMQRWVLSDNAIDASGSMRSSDVEAVALAWLARFEEIRSGAVPRNQVQYAQRLAQVERLVRLSGPSSILEEIVWQQGDPWKFDEHDTAAEIRARLQRACESASVTIQAFGVDEASAKRLRARSEELNDAPAGNRP